MSEQNPLLYVEGEEYIRKPLEPLFTSYLRFYSLESRPSQDRSVNFFDGMVAASTDKFLRIVHEGIRNVYNDPNI
jgi:hypothetical protein